MLLIKFIRMRDAIVSDWNRLCKGSPAEQDMVSAVNKFLLMQKEDHSSRRIDSLYKCYKHFNSIEFALIKRPTEELKDIYLTAKRELFYYSFLNTLSAETVAIINNNLELFEIVLDKLPEDNKPLKLSSLVSLAEQVSDKDTDIKIEVLHALLAAYHPDTAINHSLKMKTELSPVAKNVLKLTNEQALLIERACLIHDIGKLFASRSEFLDNNTDFRNVSDDNINKQIFIQAQRDHVNDGDMILELFKLPGDIKEYINKYVNFQIFALMHHEEYNGSGYFNFKGEDIPYEIQILSILDKFNALSKARPYKSVTTKARMKLIFEEEIFEKKTISEQFLELVSDLLKKYSQ